MSYFAVDHHYGDVWLEMTHALLVLKAKASTN